MSRRRAAKKREPIPDAKYYDPLVTSFINKIMHCGKKSVAERIVYGAFDQISTDNGGDPIKVFHDALENVRPDIEVRSRRVGGATYQVPVEVKRSRGQALAMRWLIAGSRSRNARTMKSALGHELFDASQGRGGAVKKREDTHRMAEANRAFSHYRW